MRSSLSRCCIGIETGVGQAHQVMAGLDEIRPQRERGPVSLRGTGEITGGHAIDAQVVQVVGVSGIEFADPLGEPDGFGTDRLSRYMTPSPCRLSASEPVGFGGQDLV